MQSVILGNHDRMIMRKAQTSLIPSKWIKSYKEVLEVPNWDFVDRLEIDGVQYIHGEAGTARTKCRADKCKIQFVRVIYIHNVILNIIAVRTFVYLVCK